MTTTPTRPQQGDTFRTETVSWVTEPADLAQLIEAIGAASAVVYDLETTGLDEHATTHGPTNGGVSARVVLASFTLPVYDDDGEVDGDPTTYLLPLSHPDSVWRGSWRATYRQVAEAMLEAPGLLVGHNVKFDHRWTYATTGVDLAHRPLWDTRISAHLVDENASTRLKERAPDTFGVPRWDDVELSFPGAAELEPIFKLGEYAARDTYWTWKLYENHRSRMLPRYSEELFGEEIEEARLGQLARWCAMPTVATLTAIEQRGIGLDEEWVRDAIEEDERTRDTAYDTLRHRYVVRRVVDEETGERETLDPDTASFAPTSHYFAAWAEAAVENGDLRIAALTPGGKPQWSKGVLAKQARAGSDIAQTLLDYRNATKRLEFLRSWLDQATAESRIHTTYNAGSVVTGRLSSSGPNMQQVTKGLRPAFVPSPGHVLVDLDYSQIELRVAAFVSRSKPMIEAFRRGDDLHRLIASRVNNKPPEEVTARERQQGKAANFGLLYGMGAMGFRAYAEDAYGVVMTEQEAAQVHEAYFEMWDGLRQWHLRQVARVNEQGQVVSPIGRVRRLPDVWDGNEQRASHAERNAINSPVQGFASDIMQIAAACIEGNIPGVESVPAARLVGTVHDSIIVEVPADQWEEVAAACKRAMEVEVPQVLERMGCEFDVPLVADAVAGTRWGLDDVGEL